MEQKIWNGKKMKDIKILLMLLLHGFYDAFHMI